ncbi:Thiolase, C-terminal domain [Variovorax sp. OV700]|nr:Thiolase, C-terminal domain [Variovorax sp. OV700]
MPNSNAWSACRSSSLTPGAPHDQTSLICDAIRTPFGRHGGASSSIRVDDLGASGARLATTAVNQLHRSGGRYALCTMCIGVGQGIAVTHAH